MMIRKTGRFPEPVGQVRHHDKIRCVPALRVPLVHSLINHFRTKKSGVSLLVSSNKTDLSKKSISSAACTERVFSVLAQRLHSAVVTCVNLS